MGRCEATTPFTLSLLSNREGSKGEPPADGCPYDSVYPGFHTHILCWLYFSTADGCCIWQCLPRSAENVHYYCYCDPQWQPTLLHTIHNRENRSRGDGHCILVTSSGCHWSWKCKLNTLLCECVGSVNKVTKPYQQSKTVSLHKSPKTADVIRKCNCNSDDIKCLWKMSICCSVTCWFHPNWLTNVQTFHKKNIGDKSHK